MASTRTKPATLRTKLFNLQPGFSGSLRSSSSHAGSSRSAVDSSTLRSSFDSDPDAPEDEVDLALRQMVWQAGVDSETRPIVCVSASDFPNGRSISYDQLLARLIAAFELFVQSDYVLVFFAAGSINSPSWSFIWKAYRGLGRSFRKNLKKMYIVHPSFYSRMLLNLASPLISPKFYAKLVYLNSLSSLAAQLPIQQLLIPPAVARENLKIESTITLPTSAPSLQFGLPLDEVMTVDEDGRWTLPRVVADAISFFDESEGALDVEGVFRRSPSAGILRGLAEAYDRGSPIFLSSYEDPHLAAVLLKKLLRDLPLPLFPASSYETIARCPPIPLSSDDHKDDTEAWKTYIREKILAGMHANERALLSAIFFLMHEVSLHHAHNLMTSSNLALVLTPNLVRSNDIRQDVLMSAVSTASAPEGSKRRRPTTLGEIVRAWIEDPWSFFSAAGKPQASTLRRARLVSVDTIGKFEIGDDEPLANSSSLLQKKLRPVGSIPLSSPKSTPSRAGPTSSVLAKGFFSPPASD